MPPGWLHPQTQSSTTRGGVTLEEFGLELDQITQEDAQNHRLTGVSAGLPESNSSAHGLPCSPRESVRARERRKRQKYSNREIKNRNTELTETVSFLPENRRLPGALARRWRCPRISALTSPCVGRGLAWLRALGALNRSQPGRICCSRRCSRVCGDLQAAAPFPCVLRLLWDL